MTAAARNLRAGALVVAAFSLVAAGLAYVVRPQPALPPLRHDAVVRAPNGTAYDVEIADENVERMQGLSRLPSMGPSEGKLFVFPAPALHSFWMKEMRFPLDIIWIQDGVVVDLAEDVPAPGPGQFPATVLPQAPAQLVLELRAGEAKRQGITQGTVLDIQWPSGYSWPAN